MFLSAGSVHAGRREAKSFTVKRSRGEVSCACTNASYYFCLKGNVQYWAATPIVQAGQMDNQRATDFDFPRSSL
jgi:hypothetical protein